MNITVNGEPRQVSADCTVATLLAELDIKAEGVAVERNMEILSREGFSEASLEAGDTIEIIRFVGGGCGQKECHRA